VGLDSVAALLRRWIDHPYGEEEITQLEDEVIPALLRLKERR
jgi:hypothetical protein